MKPESAFLKQSEGKNTPPRKLELVTKKEVVGICSECGWEFPLRELFKRKRNDGEYPLVCPKCNEEINEAIEDD